ncbi:SH2 domain-containing protein 1A-like [Nerophis lumbriciformis]|uniref:SH2 domain-containing protein 1A-like n=1 Tax=Nerophis lumbriciformis TaxID=546530 RepID=UPI002ADF5F05|nr:SH2 domain-containing protein 1A-like [Nerophis lumbriciformis]
MENLSVYHGPIGKKEGERRLALDGRDGCYLVRNSDSVPDVYCLCLLCKGRVFTYRLHKHGGNAWAAETSPGVQKRYFRYIKNLIAAFEEPAQGIVMPLLHPVTAQGRAQTPTVEHNPSNSLSPPPGCSAQGQKKRKKDVLQAITHGPLTHH